MIVYLYNQNNRFIPSGVNRINIYSEFFSINLYNSVSKSKSDLE
jgi:hypothetical protein